MSEATKVEEHGARPKVYPATVAKVIDQYQVVINRGLVHGVKPNQRFLVYRLDSEELKDPESGQPLGRVEIVRGTGVASHVQEGLTTIKSDAQAAPERRIIKRRPSGILAGLGGFSTEEEETITPSSDTLPFEEVAVGDLVKPI